MTPERGVVTPSGGGRRSLRAVGRCGGGDSAAATGLARRLVVWSGVKAVLAFSVPVGAVVPLPLLRTFGMEDEGWC